MLVVQGEKPKNLKNVVRCRLGISEFWKWFSPGFQVSVQRGDKWQSWGRLWAAVCRALCQPRPAFPTMLETPHYDFRWRPIKGDRALPPPACASVLGNTWKLWGVVLTRAICLQGTFGKTWKRFCLSQLERVVLLASTTSGARDTDLLPTMHRTTPTTKNNHPKISTVLSLRNPGLRDKCISLKHL